MLFILLMVLIVLVILAGAHGNEHEQHDRHLEALSMIESDGFFDEPDELWAKRKQRHINQMSMENMLMTTCPGRLHKLAKPCVEGCAGTEANCQGRFFFQVHYEPSFSCLLEERFGLPGDGGKWVCDPSKIRVRDNCLVYSIGSHGHYDFEEAVHDNISSKCDIHTVDMKHWRNYTTHAPPEYVTYHVNKIGPAPDTPIDALVTTLGHAGREIDILKIDCDGCEWVSYKSWFGEGVHIRQILVEIHGTKKERTIHSHAAHEFFTALFDMGYVIFHKEPNTLGCKGNCIEYAFVRLTPKFSRAKNADLS